MRCDAMQRIYSFLRACRTTEERAVGLHLLAARTTRAEMVWYSGTRAAAAHAMRCDDDAAAAAARESVCWWRRGSCCPCSAHGVWMGCGVLCIIAGGGCWRVFAWSLPGAWWMLEERRGEGWTGTSDGGVVDDSQNRSLETSLGQIKADASVSPSSCISRMGDAGGRGFLRQWSSVLGVDFPPLPQALASCQSFMLAALVSMCIGLASYAVMPAVKMPVGASVIDDALDAAGVVIAGGVVMHPRIAVPSGRYPRSSF